MPKAEAAGTESGKRRPRRQAELPDEVHGQIEEICHELAVQLKRMQQLQSQADELRTVIRQWASQSEPARTTNPSIVQNDAEK